MACEDKVFDYCGASFNDKYKTFEECIEKEFALCGGTSSTAKSENKLPTAVKVVLGLAAVFVVLKLAKVV